MANRSRDLAKEQLWRERLERFRASELKVRVFCEQEGITQASLYAWRRTIAERDGKVAPRTRAHSPQREPAFVPLVVREEPSSSNGIEILIAGGRVLKLPGSISADRLAEVVHALESRRSAEVTP